MIFIKSYIHTCLILFQFLLKSVSTRILIIFGSKLVLITFFSAFPITRNFKNNVRYKR